MTKEGIGDKASETRKVLMRSLLETHPDDAAELLEPVPPEECASVLAELPSQLGASVALRMSRARCLEGMPATE